MKSMVQQDFGDIHRGQIDRSRFFLQCDNELVAGPPLRKCQFEAGIPETGLHVIGVQRREFRDAPHAVPPDHAHVHVGPQQYAGIAHECRQTPYALRKIIFRQPVEEGRPVVFGLADDWHGQKRQQAFADADRTRAGAATAMRRRKRLVQVQVNDVKTHVTRPDFAENSVQVGAVVVKQSTRIMHELLDFHDPALKYTERGGIGQHDAGRPGPERFFQCLDIDVAIFTRRHFTYDAAAHRCRCGICAVRRIRDDDFVSFMVTVRDMIGANHRHTRKFSLRPGHRRQRDTLHAADRLQHFLEFIHALEKPLAVACGPERMTVREAWQQSQGITGPRVVFHRA